jgi:hypothetical protein
MFYFCCDEYRRAAVKAHGSLNGIDYLEVDPDWHRLYVRFIKDLDSNALIQENIRIEGGERITNISVDDVTIGSGDEAKILTVRVKEAGDFSIYTLRLVPYEDRLLEKFDPLLKAVDFSFKVNCPSDFDCRPERICPPSPAKEPEIDYLAKDYDSFRQLMLDRMAVLMPQWRERNAADLGIVLVELLAYVGDYLSYQQDAIATESYLGTARRRISVRRHARLVDYFMHNGCNARVWVQVRVKDDVADNEEVVLKKGTQLLTTVPGIEKRIPSSSSSAYNQALNAQPEVFETMHEASLFKPHNQLEFYTWGAKECCLPKGATRATLRGNYPNLKPGDVLIFAEVIGALTGEPEDADPTHRHAVRLTKVTPTEDPLGGRFPDPENGNDDPVSITEIAWDREDALPFPLCISAITDKEHGEAYKENVSVAFGNIVLADYGQTIKNEFIGIVPKPTLFRVPVASQESRCQEIPSNPIPPRFYPHLKAAPLTHAAPYNSKASAYFTMHWLVKDAIPAIVLTSKLHNKTDSWKPKRDLLNSKPDSREFVVEVETDGKTYLGFGDDKNGLRPESETEFKVTYRVGNGVAGNVGAESITHIVTDESRIKEVSNPLPARGGIEPESIEDVRAKAPAAFRTQERTVTPEDYAEVTQRHPEVQKAAATFRWTGSWHTVFVTVDRLGGASIDEKFENKIRQHLEKYRMAGYDLEIDAPRFVSLEIEMQVCVKPGYFRSDVKAALLQIFSNRILPDGRKGVFHPDNFTFGQPVYLSPLYAAAMAVSGVASVKITAFQRQGMPSTEALDKGFLSLGRLEIARLDNDPDFPERGILRLIMEGGK